MKMKRTYPTPDTARENCGPRERAMAVFKYLMGMEPEVATKHPRFELIVNAFEQWGRVVSRNLSDSQVTDIARCNYPALVEPLEEELTGEEIDMGPVELELFRKGCVERGPTRATPAGGERDGDDDDCD